MRLPGIPTKLKAVEKNITGVKTKMRDRLTKVTDVSTIIVVTQTKLITIENILAEMGRGLTILPGWVAVWNSSGVGFEKL